ncbi:hypothetical protein [Arthrobacter antioxidans]|uniref:hypothetical protein n=1 Tax=Arthrobacter antioxidans TaxID=2895818 RepID=UPI001FFF111A|nr:hypothetical protein [Arthrobacter antioxidans]
MSQRFRLTVEHLRLTGVPGDQQPALAVELEDRLRNALAGRFGQLGAQAGILPIPESEEALRDLVTDVVRRAADGTARRAGGDQP